MSDCVGEPRMPVCRENYPFVCSTIKSPDNVPIEFAIENGASVRIVFLNYQSQKHKHQRSRSRQYVFTALLDNGNVHRAAANIIVSESRAARGSVYNVLLSRHPAGVKLRKTVHYKQVGADISDYETDGGICTCVGHG